MYVYVCLFVCLFVCFQNSNYLTNERARFAVDEATVFYPIQQCDTVSPSLHYSHIVHTVHIVHIVYTVHIGLINLVVLTARATR
jgi:hypothetical protein